MRIGSSTITRSLVHEEEWSENRFKVTIQLLLFVKLCEEVSAVIYSLGTFTVFLITAFLESSSYLPVKLAVPPFKLEHDVDSKLNEK